MITTKTTWVVKIPVINDVFKVPVIVHKVLNCKYNTGSITMLHKESRRHIISNTILLILNSPFIPFLRYIINNIESKITAIDDMI